VSVDGHVDPGASTLSRLNEIARKTQPVQPEDTFLPPLREAIPGFDVTADEGTFVELPRQHVRPNGTVVTYLHADAKVTVRIENQRRNQDGCMISAVLKQKKIPDNPLPSGSPLLRKPSIV
jgi:hypothetical protein